MDYIDKLIKSINEWEIEEFDKIYYNFRENKIDSQLLDIARLCEILSNRNPDWMLPHQFLKIEKMIVMLVDKHGYDLGFEVLLKQLNLMFQKHPVHAKEILKMFIPEFQDKDKVIKFADEFSKIDNNLQTKVKEVYYEAKKRSIHVEIIDVILNRLECIE